MPTTLGRAWRPLGHRPNALHVAAWIAIACDQPSNGVQLFGAADAGLTAIGSTIWPLIQLHHDRYLAVARSMLSDADFRRAWTVGQRRWMGLAMADAMGAVTLDS